MDGESTMLATPGHYGVTAAKTNPHAGFPPHATVPPRNASTLGPRMTAAVARVAPPPTNSVAVNHDPQRGGAAAGEIGSTEPSPSLPPYGAGPATVVGSPANPAGSETLACSAANPAGSGIVVSFEPYPARSGTTGAA